VLVLLFAIPVPALKNSSSMVPIKAQDLRVGLVTVLF